MTPLETILRARIAAHGPMTVADFMAEALGHPEHGVYTARDPLGAAGDFTTAPEISQMFGELVGLALGQAWLDQGAPDEVRLVELGPGRGTLMADLLRATKMIPGFHDALDVHLVETSPYLRARQSEAVPVPVTHHADLGTVPDGPLLLIANEFFDALPVRQFRRDGDGWRERMVGIAEDRLSFGESEIVRPIVLEARRADTRDGDIVEIAPAAAGIAAEIGRRLAGAGGAALIVDYGDWRSLGDTLQALSRHERVAPLDRPGEADLTAHVDFEAVADAARPARATPLTPQGVWLERMGITARAQALARGLTGHALEAHVAAHRRLTHPAEMGTLFKVIGLFPDGAPPPSGFAM